MLFNLNKGIAKRPIILAVVSLIILGFFGFYGFQHYRPGKTPPAKELSEGEISLLPRETVPPEKVFLPLPKEAGGDGIAVKTSFKTLEQPEFMINLTKESAQAEPGHGIFSPAIARAAGIQSRVVKAEVTDALDRKLGFKLMEGAVQGKIVVPFKAGTTHPGKYRLAVEILQDGKVLATTQDFSWGVLAVNFNKSLYLPGEKAYIQMAALTDTGHTLCGANLTLKVRDPKGQEEIFNGNNGLLKKSGTCGFDNVTDNPDYFAYFETGLPGKYEVSLTNNDAGTAISDAFEVKESLPFEVERIGATRVNPFKSDYVMRLKIKANEDYSGNITETVPANFEIRNWKINDCLEIKNSEIGNCLEIRNLKLEIKNKDLGKKSLDFENIILKKGQEISLSYRYRSPFVSPEWYLLGPSAFVQGERTVFKEERAWQLASDATTAYTSGSGNWTSPLTGSVTAELHGAGGGGGVGGGSNKFGAGGGAGGQAVLQVFAATSSNSYAYAVGASGTAGIFGGTINGGVGGDSTLTVGGTTYRAKGGDYGRAYANGYAGGVGTTTGGVGSTVYAGGSGAAGVSGSYSGGGGGGAGSTGTGNAAVADAGGTAKANNGGAGGAGSTGNAAAGLDGASFGGGGGGGTKNSNGGSGAGGYVLLTYADNTPLTVTLNWPINGAATTSSTTVLNFTGNDGGYGLEYAIEIGDDGEFGQFVSDGAVGKIFNGVAVDQSNHNVYGCVGGGDIWKQNGGSGGFGQQFGINRAYMGVAVDSSDHSVYAVVDNGDIYKQASGTGSLLPLSAGTTTWVSIAIDSSNHDVYATEGNDIYKQTAGTGSFVAMGLVSQSPNYIAVDSSNHNVYYVDMYSVYKQTAATGSFALFSSDGIQKYGISVNSSNHDVFVLTFYNMYRQVTGSGSFAILGPLLKGQPRSIAIDSSNQKVYVASYLLSDVFVYTPFRTVKYSFLDAGFSPGHPFISGNGVSYTIQDSEALPAGKYYWRVAGISPTGLNTWGGWSASSSFKVVALSTVTTQAVSNISYTTATGNGNITADGFSSSTRRGFCYMPGTSGDPTTANSVVYDNGTFGLGAFSKGLTGLSSTTDYRVRAYAVNAAGTAYGTTVQLTTLTDGGGGGGGSAYATPTPAEFVSIVDTGNASGTDYTSLSAWEAGVQADLTASTTLVFSATSTGGLADNTSVTLYRGGSTQGITATVVHNATSSQQAMLENISSSTFAYLTGDQWRVDATHLVTLASSTPHSVIAVAKCRDTTGLADTNFINIDGWVTSATNYVKVWTDPSENYRHHGVWDEGKYRVVVANAMALLLQDGFITIDGLELWVTATDGTIEDGVYIGNHTSVAGYNISNNIMRGSLANAYDFHSGISVYNAGTSGSTIKIWNNVIYDFVGTSFDMGVDIDDPDFTAYVYNNTVYNSSNGYVTQAGCLSDLKNNIAYNNINNYYLIGSYAASSTNNLTGPGTDADIPATNARNGVIVHFADEANNDFHLDSADTGARNKGKWLATDTALALIDDIDGDSRILAASSSVDIGADENIAKIYRSVGPSATTALATGGSSNYGNLEIKLVFLATSTNRVIDYVATFWRPLPDNAGVGDAIQYDSDDNGTIDSVAFITKRWDSAHFSVRTATGSAPTATLAPDADFSVFRAYTSLANAEGGTTENTSISAGVVNFDNWSGGKDIGASQEQWNIACYANGTASDTAVVSVTGWTTATSSYVRIYTPTRSDEVGVNQRHQGDWDVNKYRLEVTNGNTLAISTGNIRIDGLQIKNLSDTLGARRAVSATNIVGTGKISISNNLIQGSYPTAMSSVMGITYYTVTPDVNPVFYVYNNVIYNFAYGGMTAGTAYGIIGNTLSYAYNNTIINSYDGIAGNSASGTVFIKNNIVQDCVDGYDNMFNVSSDYNLSDLAADAPGVHSKNSVVVSFVSTATSSEDFHLLPGDYAARNAGGDLTNDLYLPINSDMDSATPSAGNNNYCSLQDEQCLTRPRGTMWDIGADELITKIYRSVAPDNNLDNNLSSIASGTNAITLAIASGTAAFSAAMPDNAGVGDALQYDSDGNGTIDKLAFISGRASTTGFSLQSATGTLPVSTPAGASTSAWVLFRAYTSLSYAETGTENQAINGGLVNFDTWSGGRDIASTSEQWNIAAYSNGTSSDVAVVTVDGWNTATRNFIKVYTPYLSSEVGVSQRHQGKWDGTKYNLKVTNPGHGIVESYDENIYVDGLQIFLIRNSGIGGMSGIYSEPYDNSVLNVRISNNIIKGQISGGSDYTMGIQFETGNSISGKAYAWNNIVYDFNYNGLDSGIFCRNGSSKYISNNTIYNNINGINVYDGSTDINAKNNIVNGSGNANAYVGTFSADSDYNATDGTDTDGQGMHSRITQTFSFVDEANDDFHLAPSDTGARGFGDDLSKDQLLPITKDIDGQSVKFPVSSFQFPNHISNVDIGADQSATPIYRSAAPGLTTALDAGSEDGNRLTIASGTLTLATATPDNVGVGDAVQYDSDGNGSIDAIAFISGRASSSQYTVQNREGGVPVNVVNDLDWAIYRAYTSLSNMLGYYGGQGTENSGISDKVEHFDIDWSGSANRGKDIYAANQQWNAAAYASGTVADTDSFHVGNPKTNSAYAGWNTYPTDYIRIFTPYLLSEVGKSQRHQGKWDENKYRIESASTEPIGAEPDYVQIEGLQVKNFSAGVSYPVGITVSTKNLDSDMRVSDNIVRADLSGLTGTGYGTGIYAGSTNSSYSNIKVWNNIVYGWTNSISSTSVGISCIGANTEAHIYNNTVYGCDKGISGTGIKIIKNNISYKNLVKDYNLSFDPSSTNNLSSDWTVPAYGTYYASATVAFADEANKDFHLAGADTGARNRGADLASDSWITASAGMTKDIDGHTRSTTSASGAWDIGADEGATAMYFSVGQNTSNHMTGTPNVTIASGVATFDTPQTALTTGVGDAVTYNTNNVVYITGKSSTTVWTVRTATGTIPADIAGSGVVSIAHAFASLEGAVDGNNANGAFDSTHLNTKDLYANNIQMNVPCYYDSGPDTTAVFVQGWTTAVPNFLKIYTPTDTAREVNQSQRHSGKWDEGKFRLEIATYINFKNYVNFFVVDGLQIKDNFPSINNSSGLSNSTSDYANLYISNNIVWGNATQPNSAYTGIGAGIVNGKVYIWNNIVFGFNNHSGGGNGITAGSYQNPTSIAYVYNNTVYDCYNGITTSDNNQLVLLKNNISYNNAIDYVANPYFGASSTNNISKDATAPAYGKYFRNATVRFADVAGWDFHLDSFDTVAKNAGTNLATDTLFAFTPDIDGQNRSTSSLGRAWDIGADEAATGIYYSVGQDGTTDRKMAATISIASTGLATFSAPQTGNIGVGDVIDYGASQKAYIASKVDQSNWYVANATGTVATTTGATVNSIKRAFSSLSLAEAGAPALLGTSDLFNNNYQLNFPCYYDNGADGTSLTINGYITSPSNYLKIYTPASTTSESNVSQRHSGKWDDSKYNRLSNINITSGSVRIDGLQVAYAGSSQIVKANNSDDAEVFFSNNIIKNDYTPGSMGISFVIFNPSFIGKAWNNIIYGLEITDNQTRGIYTSGGCSVYAYNNTVIGGYYGFYSVNRLVAKNNITKSSADGFVGSMTGDYNLSDIAGDTSGVSVSASYRNGLSTEVAFADSANLDFHLASSDAYAHDYGADLSADSGLAVVDDVDGQRRDESRLYDIGADEGATAVFYSVGQNIINHATGSPTITIASGTATFSVAQTATTTGVGDKVTYNTSDVVYITSKSSTTVWTVRTATGTIPANITSSAVVSITHAFASLEGAVDATTGSGAFDASHLGTKDLLANNYQLNVPCYYDSGPDTTAVIVDGWNTGIYNYIKLYTPNNLLSEVNQTQRHAGKWDNAKYRIEISGNATALDIKEENSKIDGLQVFLSSSSNNNDGILFEANGTNNAYISNNIVKGPGTTTLEPWGIAAAPEGTGSAYVWNNIVYDFYSATAYPVGIGTYGGVGAIVYMYNNTAYNNARGIGTWDVDNINIAKNNLAYNNLDNYINYAGTFSASSTNNLSGPTQNDAPGLNQQNQKTVLFVSTSTADFHLDPSDTSAKGQGADLSADPYLIIIDDIDGDTRYSPWDIGADDAGAGGAPADTGQAVIRLHGGVRLHNGMNMK